MKTTQLAIGLFLISLSAAIAAPPPAKLALQGGRIIPVVGEEIASGTVLIENGRITAVGSKVEIPYDAMVVDVSGKVLFPGMIAAHTSGGLDRANENLPVTPFLDVYDSLDPSSLFFEDALRDGILALHVIQGNNCVIGGLSRVVRPIGRTIDEMTIRPSLALKFATSPKRGYDRMTQMAAMREAFRELDYYLNNLAEKKYEEKLKEEEKDLDVLPEEARRRGRELITDADLDDKHENLVKLTDGRLAAWIYCGSATDVGPAIRTAKENGFLERSVFVMGPDAHRAVSELKEAGRPVVLPQDLIYQRRDPITGELEETFVPKVVHDAGLTFALLPHSDASLAERYMTYQAARCVREGISRAVALEAISINPARMLGIEDHLGSIEVGKAACIVVFSGDPLDFNSWVEKAYIDGVLAYDRAQDVRLNELLGLEPDEPSDEVVEETPAAKPTEEAKEEPEEESEATTAEDSQ